MTLPQRKDQPTAGDVHVDAPIGSRKPRKILKSDSHKRYVLGVVYAPDDIDSQGDFTSAEEIESACWDFNTRQLHLADVGSGLVKAMQGNPARVYLPVGNAVVKGALGLQHKVWDDDLGDIIESYIAPADMDINGQKVTKGTWLIGAILAPDIFRGVLDGKLTGFSMGGSGERVTVKEKANA